MSNLFEKFSSRENLKRAYSYVQNELAHSSLSINPINHPSITAINALGEQFFVALEGYLRDGKYTPERGFFVYLPKDNLAIRPVQMLSMIDRIVYQAMFNPKILGNKIDGQLSDKVCYANRVDDNEEATSYLFPYYKGWDDFYKSQEKAFASGFIWKTELDVQQYFENILIGNLTEKLRTDFGIKDDKMLRLLQNQLTVWAEYTELPSGIPQGPSVSALLGNAYLSSLDRFVEENFSKARLRYGRYNDDIILMGKSKEDVLKATEKIVRFLRELNLNLNEKTRLTKLADTETIEAMRLSSDYDDSGSEIPDDEFARIKAGVPNTIQAIVSGEQVEKLKLRELKYYLKVGAEYDIDFILNLVSIIPLRPSLTTSIVQYVGDGRTFLQKYGDPIDTLMIDNALWDTYNNNETLEWSRFWILKLLVSSEDGLLGEIEKELHRILASKDGTIFKIVGFYYEAMRGRKIDIDLIKSAVKGSATTVEQALYSFFLLNSFEGLRVPAIQNIIEKLVNSTSQEVNLIGCYLQKCSPSILIDDVDGSFSSYILKRKKFTRKTRVSGARVAVPKFYIVPSEALTPFTTSPTDILGVNRKSKAKHSVTLALPAVIQWEKVTIKMKEGLCDVEIFYDEKFCARADYEQLGFFSGKKQRNPDRQWSFLRSLSVLSGTDITKATAHNMMVMVAKDCGRTISMQAVYKIKETLSKRLRSLFQTDADPFYDEKSYYHPRFTILPEADLRNTEVWRQGGRLDEELAVDDTDTEEN